jgi:hypothetical protein
VIQEIWKLKEKENYLNLHWKKNKYPKNPKFGEF